MFLQKKLQKALQEALAQVYAVALQAESLVIQPTLPAFEGTHTLLTFPLTSHVRKSPAEVAEQLGSWLIAHTKLIASYNVKKGFLNLTLTNNTWLKALTHIQNLYKEALVINPQKVVIEFSSPNTNKPLHLGHLRNIFIGHSLSKIFKALGHQVYKVNLVNDRGMHICKSMVAYQHFGKQATPASTKIKGDHFVGRYYVLFEQNYQKQVAVLTEKLADKALAAKQAPLLQEVQHMLTEWEAGNKEVIALWEKMNRWVYEGFEKTYKQIEVSFDRVYYESQTYLLGKNIVAEGLAKGVFYQKEDKSTWVDLSAQGLDEKILLRANGTSVYITQDMGTIEERYKKYGFDNHIYVVGNEQDYHFKVLFETLKKLERPYAKRLYHLSYGMVDLPDGKMKSREGTVVDADELIAKMIATTSAHTKELGKVQELEEQAAQQLFHTLGMGALKYFLLKVKPQKRLLFDPKASIDLQGHTAPFIQYTHARIYTLLQKATAFGYTFDTLPTTTTPLQKEEIQVILQLTQYPSLLQKAAASYNPSIMAQYVYELAKTYNRLYANKPILQEKDKQVRTRRLYISMHTAASIKKTMGLLGIKVPNKM